MSAPDQFQAAEFGIRARADAVADATGPFVREEHRLGDGPIETAAPGFGGTGAIGGETLAVPVEIVTPAIDQALHQNTDLHRAGPQAQNTTAVQPRHPMGRLDVRVDVDGLVHVELPILAPAQGVQDVVRVFRAEGGEHDAALVGAAIAVGIFEVKQLSTMTDVAAAVPRLNASRDEQAIGKDARFLGVAVAVGVFQNDDFVVGNLAGFDLGIDFAAGDPQAALAVEVHLDRLGEKRVLRKQIDFEAGAEVELGRRQRSVRERSGWSGGPGRGLVARGIGGQQFERALHGFAEQGDLFFLLFDERIELRDFLRVLALLVLAEEEEIRVVLWSVAIKEQLILPANRVHQSRGLRVVRTAVDGNTAPELVVLDGLDVLTIDDQIVIARLETEGLKAAVGQTGGAGGLAGPEGRQHELLGLQNEPGAPVFGARDVDEFRAVAARAELSLTGDAGPPNMRLPLQFLRDGLGHAPVPVTVEVNAVVGERLRLRGEFEQVHKMGVVAGGNLLEHAGVIGELRVVRHRIGQRRRQLLVPDRAEDDQAHFARAGAGLQRVEELLHVGLEARQTGVAVERRRHPVAEEGDGRFHERQLFLEAVEALVRRVESGARDAQRGIGAPAQVAERDVAVGKMGRSQMLDKAELLFPFDESVAQEYHAVAVPQLEGVGVLGASGRQGKSRGHQGRQQTAMQFHSAKVKKLKPQMNTDGDG